MANNCKKCEKCTLDFLCSLPLFKNADRQKLQMSIDSNSFLCRSYSPGETIYSPRDKKKKLGFLLSGTASVFSADENNSVLLRMLETGDTFGVANLFSSKEQFVSLIVAKKACSVLFFSQETIAALLKEDAVFCMNYIHFLSDRICFLNSKISCFTAGSPERKLAFFLLSCAEDKMGQYSLTINANSLSDMLNVGRASLYRAFDSLVAEGLIQKQGKQITVLDKNALKTRFC
jgi:CRP-like cAMP-binding protein